MLERHEADALPPKKYGRVPRAPARFPQLTNIVPVAHPEKTTPTETKVAKFIAEYPTPYLDARFMNMLVWLQLQPEGVGKTKITTLIREKLVVPFMHDDYHFESSLELSTLLEDPRYLLSRFKELVILKESATHQTQQPLSNSSIQKTVKKSSPAEILLQRLISEIGVPTQIYRPASIETPQDLSTLGIIVAEDGMPMDVDTLNAVGGYTGYRRGPQFPEPPKMPTGLGRVPGYL